MNGLLVDPDDSPALARRTSCTFSSDRREAERLGEAARQTGDEWRTTPAEYAQHVEALVRGVLAGLT